MWCVNAFQNLGFETSILKSEGVEHVYAERIYAKKKKSILFYLQIDGQPVDASKWNQPDPFIPALKEIQDDEWKIIDWDSLSGEINPDWRIYARSASDSKGPAMAFMAAIQLLQQQKIKPDFNIKVIMDFQEEMSSPTLPALVKANKEMLQAEMLLIMDGTRHPSNLPTLTFGARGISTITLKVFGADDNLHSGQYGNFAPNPVFKLADLLAGMKDEYGRVTVPGFYNGITLTEKDKALINASPEDLEEMKSTLGIAEPDRVGATYQEALQFPSLNVRGLRAGWVGNEVRTIIPSEAIAEIDMRLVPETPGMRQVERVKAYVESKGYHFVDSIPTKEERAKYSKLISFTYRIGTEPFRTNINSPIGEWLGNVMTRTFGEGNYVNMQATGGSQPIAPFVNTLNIPAVSIRIPNPDNSIHAPNENMRVGNFIEGIQTCIGILTEKL